MITAWILRRPFEGRVPTHLPVFPAAYCFVAGSAAIVPNESSSDTTRTFDPLLEAHATTRILVNNSSDGSPLHDTPTANDSIAKTLSVSILLLQAHCLIPRGTAAVKDKTNSPYPVAKIQAVTLSARHKVPYLWRVLPPPIFNACLANPRGRRQIHGRCGEGGWRRGRVVIVGRRRRMGSRTW